MSTSRFAYKELPKFEPKYYRQWARVVRDAFAERDWNDYLIIPAPVAVPSTEVGQSATVTPSLQMQASPPVPRHSSPNQSSFDINPLSRLVKQPPKSGLYSCKDMANDLETMS